MKKTAFWIRTIILLASAILPALHPGVVLAFDAGRLWFSFVLVPAACLLAFYGPSLPRLRNVPGAVPVALVFALFTLRVDGLSVTSAVAVAGFLVLYADTILVFRRGVYRLLYAEPIVIVWMAWRLSEFSRSSVVLADESRMSVLAIFVIALLFWALYAVVMYLLEYDDGRRTGKSGYVRLALAFIAFIALFSLALSGMPEKITDYVQRINSADRRIPPKKGRGDIKGTNSAKDGENPSDRGRLVEAGDGNWYTNPEQNSGDDGQHMVMIVDSPVDTLYLAEEYRGRIDPVEGFVPDSGYFANALAHTPYLETWENPDIDTDQNRTPVWIEVYSAIPDKLTSWMPYRIEPTVLNEKNFPLRYNYRALSLVSSCSLTGVFPFIPPLAGLEREGLEPFLDVPVPETELAPFREYLSTLLAGTDSYEGKIRKILEGFKVCQYQAGGEDDASIEALRRFLFVSKKGDCTEFSNSAALLARLAGIPSRVATGYAVRKDLQTRAHKEGIRRIVEKFPPLKGRSADTLFLVTTAHAHSWPEFYLPGSGWVDFESTEFALPPEAGSDPNGADIVIPEFDTIGETPRSRFSFPWLLLAKLALLAFASVVVIRFVRRAIILASLFLIARRSDARGAKARFRLFLVRLACRGYRRKLKSETPREYGAAFSELVPIIEWYEIAVLHPDSEKRADAKRHFDVETRAFLTARRGLLPLLREVSGIHDGGLL